MTDNEKLVEVSLSLENRACTKCGLIQMHDEIFGSVFCDSKEAFFYGCPEKEEWLKRFPSSQYDESIIPLQKMTRPFIYEPKV
ncbi:hypothetical protein [Pedobacter sp.]|jgi:hypothetical protein|uniref:hypothetical protein n=1 Tax=Pedobacter sp. TaxID=1411316 RepID=UPI002C7D3A9E|nr:hypothetical protein [Pedobacter sp.]HWW39645.1 hypothetical protein [Pedobacter sp.]